MSHVVLLTRGTLGDLFPFLSIGSEMKSRGHEITLVTHRHYEDTVRKAGLGFANLDHSGSFEEKLREAVSTKMQDLVADLRDGLETIVPACEQFGKLLRLEDTVLVAHHNSHIAGQIFAEKYRVPLVSIFTAPALVINMPVYEEIYDLASDDINAVRAAAGLPPVQSWRCWWKGIKWGVGLWPEWFAPPELAWPTNLSLVGFVLKEDGAADVPREVQSMLDSGEHPILITHGTRVPPKSGFFEASVGACLLLDRPGILVTQHPQVVPHPLPDNVKWFRHVPSLAKLMPDMAAVIHHGGMGVTGQALAAGVAQVVLAFGVDRPDNGFRIRSLGAGENVPPARWQPDAVAEVLARVVDSRGVRERCEALREKFVGIDAVGAACDVVEESLQNWDGLVEPVPGTKVEDVCDPGRVEKQEGRLSQQPPTDNLSPEKRALLAMRLRSAQNNKHTECLVGQRQWGKRNECADDAHSHQKSGGGKMM